ncbi:hypothetical protein [Ruminococcus sp. CAG:330]|uniref:hypothetical protein n=1 Tax=Ruminococcus sp. CAG:330 TaxID=1262954 RepID=UPI0003408C56|nr:hypothetical protein [Ruminococcus sp. CAG:330]CDE12456.1 putative uncharacterized protein [Ruminococcus sp. CAG:330]
MNLFSGVVLLGVVFAALAAGIWRKQSNVLELLGFGVIFWLCAWVITAMGLFVLDAFRLFRCAAGTAFLLLLCGGVLLLWRRRKEACPWNRLCQVSWDIREYWIPLLVCAGGLVLVAVKHGFFGMGQDEGVYQTVAVNLMNGITDRQQDFAEYHQVPAEQQETFAQSIFQQLAGYDTESAGHVSHGFDTSISPVSGIYHGIPTYASLLAVWGTIFGMSRMLDIQTVFYCCTVFLVFQTCRNFQLKKSATALACAVTAASPIVIWVAKSALTEGFLGVLFALYLYFLTERETRRQWLSILPIAVFGCFHVSIYTMVPLFVLVYGGMYWFTRRRCFAVLMPAAVLGYLVSFFAMRRVQPFYTTNNYSPLFGLGINQDDLSWFVPAVCGGALVLCAGFVLLTHVLGKRHPEKQTEELRLQAFRQSVPGVIVAEVLLTAMAALIGLRCLTAESVLDAISHASLWGFLACTGIIPFLAAWGLGVIRPRFYLESTQRLVALVTFFYCVLFYAAVLRPEVQYFYYYGRYLAPFLPVAAVFLAVTLDRLRARVTLPVLAAGLLVVAPYDRFLSIQRDDTRLEWSVLEETAQELSSDDCMIVSDSYMSTMYLPLRAISGAAVYPEADDLLAQAKALDERYDKVFYLGTEDWDDSFAENFRLTYANRVTQSNDDNVSGRAGLLPFPLAYQEAPVSVTLYTYQSEKLTYPADECASTMYRGFGGLEGNFCWSNSEEASVRCMLCQQDYTMTLQMGCMLDLNRLGFAQYPVTIEINGKSAGTVTVDESNNGQSLSLDIPAACLEDGQNIVTLRCDLWEAKKISESDPRLLGFPLKSIVFTPQG